MTTTLTTTGMETWEQPQWVAATITSSRVDASMLYPTGATQNTIPNPYTIPYHRHSYSVNIEKHAIIDHRFAKYMTDDDWLEAIGIENIAIVDGDTIYAKEIGCLMIKFYFEKYKPKFYKKYALLIDK